MYGKNRSKKIILFTFALFFSFENISAHAEKNHFRLIIFGDSLVDVGNIPIITGLISQSTNGDLRVGFVVPPLTRYDRGRFSNGPVISDYLATRLGTFLKPSVTGFDLETDSVSYAYGGAETGSQNLTLSGFPVPGLSGQVEKFAEDLAQSEANLDKVTFIIWAGANDYLNAFLQGLNPNPNLIVDNILNAVDELSSLGAKRIIVINLPDLGKVPICSNFGICEPLTFLTNLHNQLLAHYLPIKKSQGLNKLVLFDARSILDDLLDNPEQFGFDNDLDAGPASGCLYQLPSEFLLENCTIVNFTNKKIFWDEVHPTTRVHQILANEISGEDLIGRPGLPESKCPKNNSIRPCVR